ncbi:MAG: nicotinate-nucleotide--dimethylbenzimidazole phosphoribosyltransferase [Eubacteriales bacterium]|nr:nicotinate-nucleotide--dimethylbenzimidazole phosphoribosyltransferase [Eubacteriales bacterium]
MTLEQVLERIPPLDAEAMAQAKRHWDALAKPLHGLGDLEDVLIRIAGICRTPHIDLRNKAVVVMCADNGVVEEGISQSGQDVTQIITENLGKGTSTVCHMARAAGADVIPVDIGVASDIHGSGVVPRKIARGTHNFAKQPAMSRDQAVQAIGVGIETALLCKQHGYDVVATGEMGIGNTTSTAAVTAALLHAPVELVTGRGSGLTSEGLVRKIQVVTRALEQWQPNQHDPIDILSKVGGYDLCGLTGLFLGGALCGLPMIIDGVISSAAALCAVRLCPTVRGYLIASHHTAEPAGVLLEQALDVKPMIDAHMALGEGTGAVLLFGMLDAAASLYTNGNTFDDSNIEAYQPLS